MLRSHQAAPLALALLGTYGCIGDIGDDGRDAELPTDPSAFVCTPGDPSATVLPRLSRDQYLASLSSLATSYVGAADATAVLQAIDFALATVPADSDPSDKTRDHDRLVQTVSQAHVDNTYAVAVAFAAQLSAPARIGAVVGACATDADTSNDAVCVEDFIRSFGRRAHRRPLSDGDVAFYRDEVFQPAVGVEAAAIQDVITVMVLSPHFLYRVENEGEPVDGRADLFQLSPHELASRLSFHFWNEPPDDALFAAAESGALATEEGYAAEVDRLLADPRTRATIDRFFVEWLWMDDLAPLHNGVGQPAYDAFVGADVPTPELSQRVIDDALDLVRYTAWQSGGTLDDLFLSDLNFAKTPDVAALYGGVPVWQEGTEPASLPAGTRAGILTRPAMLATGSVYAHGVLRAREVRRRVLCDDVPAPPPGATDPGNLPVVDPISTDRQKMEAYTEQTGSSCSACHSRLNPIGYTLDGYDGLGRVRTAETLYAEDGSVLATLPLDTSSVPRILGADETAVTNGVELSQLIVESELPYACFARHYFRFTHARLEDDAVDGCELEATRVQLRDGGSLAGALRDVAMSPTFRLRKLAE